MRAVLLYLFLRLGRGVGWEDSGAISRIFGFLILAIAVQLIWDEVVDFNG